MFFDICYSPQHDLSIDVSRTKKSQKFFANNFSDKGFSNNQWPFYVALSASTSWVLLLTTYYMARCMFYITRFSNQVLAGRLSGKSIIFYVFVSIWVSVSLLRKGCLHLTINDGQVETLIS